MPVKAISLTYKKLINHTPDLLLKLREKWEADGLEIDDGEWQEALASPKEVAISAKLRLVQLKILHRTYISGNRLVLMGRGETGLCKRNCGEPSTFLHIIWECPLIQKYWKKVHIIMKDVWGVRLRLEVKRCILNVWEPTDLTAKGKTWATLGQMIAKRNIARLWGADTLPTIRSWKADLDWCMLHEKSVYIARGCPQKWIAIWSNWNEYRGNLCEPP